MTDESGSGNAAELFADAPFDAATLASMIEAYAAALHELQARGTERTPRSDEVRWKLAARILKAASAGERDPERMKCLAVQAVYGRSSGVRRPLTEKGPKSHRGAYSVRARWRRAPEAAGEGNH